MGRKGKDRTAAQKRADAAASRRMKGTNPFKNRKRRGRKSASPKAPRRRRYSMARKRKSGGRRRGVAITPLRIAKAGTVIAGVVAAKPLADEVSYIITHADQIAKEGGKSMLQHGKQAAQAAIVPAALILVAPKLEEKAVQFMSRGEPLIGKVARYKIAKV